MYQVVFEKFETYSYFLFTIARNSEINARPRVIQKALFEKVAGCKYRKNAMMPEEPRSDKPAIKKSLRICL